MTLLISMWYAMILIWHLQRFLLSKTQSSNPLKGAWPHVNATRWREGKGPQVNQGNTLNSDAGNLWGDRTHSRWRADIWSPCTQDPDPRGWGETHTITRPCTWGHTSTLSKVTPPPQTLHLGSQDPWLGHQVSAGPLRWKRVGSCNLLLLLLSHFSRVWLCGTP